MKKAALFLAMLALVAITFSCSPEEIIDNLTKSTVGEEDRPDGDPDGA